MLAEKLLCRGCSLINIADSYNEKRCCTNINNHFCSEIYSVNTSRHTVHVAGVFYLYDHKCTLVIVETLPRNTKEVTQAMHVFVVQSTWLNLSLSESFYRICLSSQRVER